MQNNPKKAKRRNDVFIYCIVETMYKNVHIVSLPLYLTLTETRPCVPSFQCEMIINWQKAKLPGSSSGARIV